MKLASITKPLREVGLLTIALTLALLANFAYGQWIGPSAPPPGGNVAPPINVSSNYQYKAGNLGAVNLIAASSTRSDLYCDFSGGNCWSPASTTPGGGSGGSFGIQSAAWVTGKQLGSNSLLEQGCPAGEVLVGLRLDTIGSCPGSCSQNTGPIERIDMLCAAIGEVQGGSTSGGGASTVTQPQVSYQWSVSGWSACQSNSCSGSGSQSRTVQCLADGQVVANTVCESEIGPAPSNSQSCFDPGGTTRGGCR